MKSRNLLRWGGNIFCLTLICFLSFLIFLMVQQERNGGETPSFGGYKLMIVLSGSMKPAFDTGSLIAVREIDPKELKEGEIITYQDVENTGRLITHRVVGIINEAGYRTFITKGDNNETRDFSAVPAENVIGKVMAAVPYIGYLAGFSGSKAGVLLFLLIPVLLAAIGEFRAVHQIFGRKENIKVEK